MDLLNTGLSWANDLQTVDSRNCGLQPQYFEIFIWSLEGFQNNFLDSACTVYFSRCLCLSRLKVGPWDFSWFWDDLMIRICIDHAYTVHASIFHWGFTVDDWNSYMNTIHFKGPKHDPGVSRADSRYDRRGHTRAISMVSRGLWRMMNIFAQFFVIKSSLTVFKPFQRHHKDSVSESWQLKPPLLVAFLSMLWRTAKHRTTLPGYIFGLDFAHGEIYLRSFVFFPEWAVVGCTGIPTHTQVIFSSTPLEHIPNAFTKRL